MSFRI